MLLSKWERELAVAGIIREREYQELRRGLVEKYGEDGVQKVEQKIQEGK